MTPIRLEAVAPRRLLLHGSQRTAWFHVGVVVDNDLPGSAIFGDDLQQSRMERAARISRDTRRTLVGLVTEVSVSTTATSGRRKRSETTSCFRVLFLKIPSKMA